MNDCLIAKQIQKIYAASNELWFRIIKAKYFPGGIFIDANSLRGSRFWKSLQKVKILFNWGARFQIGNGCIISFQRDVLVGNYPLKVQFDKLFSVCQSPNISIANCCSGVGRRSIFLETLTVVLGVGRRSTFL